MKIRPASAGDLEPLGAVFASERGFFADCLARQEAGSGVLLVAWLDGWPAGDVFLNLGPADEPEVRRHLPGVPTLVHLEVAGRLQRRGIGTALVAPVRTPPGGSAATGSPSGSASTTPARGGSTSASATPTGATGPP
jgi:GNAT superfamily N-acetyltransferase